jgi:hypothetical protein
LCKFKGLVFALKGEGIAAISFTFYTSFGLQPIKRLKAYQASQYASRLRGGSRYLPVVGCCSVDL